MWQEWQRDDRAYCSSAFFRAKQANASAFWSEQLCNAEMDERNRTCTLNQCSQCFRTCVHPWLQSVVGVARCTYSSVTLGQQYCQYVSDAGQRINAMHGAVRTTGYPPVPERAFAESYKICIDNEDGRVARDGAPPPPPPPSFHPACPQTREGRPTAGVTRAGRLRRAQPSRGRL